MRLSLLVALMGLLSGLESLACSLGPGSPWGLNEKSFYSQTSTILVVEVIGQTVSSEKRYRFSREKIKFRGIKVLKGNFKDQEFERPFFVGENLVEAIPNLLPSCDIALNLIKGKKYIFTPDAINPSMIAPYSEAEEARVLKLVGVK